MAEDSIPLHGRDEVRDLLRTRHENQHSTAPFVTITATTLCMPPILAAPHTGALVHEMAHQASYQIEIDGNLRYHSAPDRLLNWIGGSRQQTADSRQQTADSRQWRCKKSALDLCVVHLAKGVQGPSGTARQALVERSHPSLHVRVCVCLVLYDVVRRTCVVGGLRWKDC
jgi:hypothetical protein